MNHDKCERVEYKEEYINIQQENAEMIVVPVGVARQTMCAYNKTEALCFPGKVFKVVGNTLSDRDVELLTGGTSVDSAEVSDPTLVALGYKKMYYTTKNWDRRNRSVKAFCNAKNIHGSVILIKSNILKK